MCYLYQLFCLLYILFGERIDIKKQIRAVLNIGLNSQTKKFFYVIKKYL